MTALAMARPTGSPRSRPCGSPIFALRAKISSQATPRGSSAGLKTTYHVDGYSELFQGEQWDVVMEALQKQMTKLGVK